MDPHVDNQSTPIQTTTVGPLAPLAPSISKTEVFSPQLQGTIAKGQAVELPILNSENSVSDSQKVTSAASPGTALETTRASISGKSIPPPSDSATQIQSKTSKKFFGVIKKAIDNGTVLSKAPAKGTGDVAPKKEAVKDGTSILAKVISPQMPQLRANRSEREEATQNREKEILEKPVAQAKAVTQNVSDKVSDETCTTAVVLNPVSSALSGAADTGKKAAQVALTVVGAAISALDFGSSLTATASSGFSMFEYNKIGNRIVETKAKITEFEQTLAKDKAEDAALVKEGKPPINGLKNLATEKQIAEHKTTLAELEQRSIGKTATNLQGVANLSYLAGGCAEISSTISSLAGTTINVAAAGFVSTGAGAIAFGVMQMASKYQAIQEDNARLNNIDAQINECFEEIGNIDRELADINAGNLPEGFTGSIAQRKADLENMKTVYMERNKALGGGKEELEAKIKDIDKVLSNKSTSIKGPKSEIEQKMDAIKHDPAKVKAYKAELEATKAIYTSRKDFLELSVKKEAQLKRAKNIIDFMCGLAAVVAGVLGVLLTVGIIVATFGAATPILFALPLLISCLGSLVMKNHIAKFQDKAKEAKLKQSEILQGPAKALSEAVATVQMQQSMPKGMNLSGADGKKPSTSILHNFQDARAKTTSHPQPKNLLTQEQLSATAATIAKKETTSPSIDRLKYQVAKQMGFLDSNGQPDPTEVSAEHIIKWGQGHVWGDEVQKSKSAKNREAAAASTSKPDLPRAGSASQIPISA